MNITNFDKELVQSIEAKADTFMDLATELIAAIFLFKFFPNNIPEFPPSQIGIEAMKKVLMDVLDSSGTDGESNLLNKEAERENFEMNIDYIKSFFSHWEHYLLEIDITNIDSAIKLVDGCTAVSICYSSILTFKDDIEPQVQSHASNYIDKIGLRVSNKAHETIGYLTAKMEERKKLKNNVESGSKVQWNKKTLEILWKEAGCPNPDKLPITFLSNAMIQIKRRERTVKNLIKEIAKEQMSV